MLMAVLCSKVSAFSFLFCFEGKFSESGRKLTFLGISAWMLYLFRICGRVKLVIIRMDNAKKKVCALSSVICLVLFEILF